MDIEKIIKISEKIKIKLTNEMKDTLKKESIFLDEQIKLFDTFDLNGVKPLDRVREEVTSYLRPDDEKLSDLLTREQVVSGADNSSKDYIRVKKEG